jgi:hypothetical protein
MAASLQLYTEGRIVQKELCKGLPRLGPALTIFLIRSRACAYGVEASIRAAVEMNTGLAMVV